MVHLVCRKGRVVNRRRLPTSFHWKTSECPDHDEADIHRAARRGAALRKVKTSLRSHLTGTHRSPVRHSVSAKICWCEMAHRENDTTIQKPQGTITRTRNRTEQTSQRKLHQYFQP